jgi:hypothetical protein
MVEFHFRNEIKIDKSVEVLEVFRGIPATNYFQEI